MRIGRIVWEPPSRTMPPPDCNRKQSVRICSESTRICLDTITSNGYCLCTYRRFHPGPRGSPSKPSAPAAVCNACTADHLGAVLTSICQKRSRHHSQQRVGECTQTYRPRRHRRPAFAALHRCHHKQSVKIHPEVTSNGRLAVNLPPTGTCNRKQSVKTRHKLLADCVCTYVWAECLCKVLGREQAVG